MDKKGNLNSSASNILNSIRRNNALIEKELKKLLVRKEEEISIPISIFNEKLGMLEASSLYLKDELDLSFNDIARLLKRDYKTIWTSYKKAKKKVKDE